LNKKFILSIWWGYCSGAALFENSGGKLLLIAASSEERFSREKNSVAFPCKTLEWFRNEFGLDKSNLSTVVRTGSDVGADYILYNKHRWSISDYVDENRNFWHKKLIDRCSLTTADYHELFKARFDTVQYPGPEFWDKWITSGSIDAVNAHWDAIVNDAIRGWFSDHDGEISMFHADHHESHAYYAFYSQQERETTLVFTADGWGDGRNGTVSVIASNANGRVCRTQVHSSVACNLARVYRFMTLLLGMKPSDHEFKVMGLAPYGKSEHSEKAYQIFMEAMRFHDGDFRINPLLTDSYYWFKERLEGERFDNIASGLQRWLEVNLILWVTYYVEKTGVKRIAFSGGVAMNVKAMGVIAQLLCVDSLHVPPSSGDESHIFGAAYTYAASASMACKSVQWNGLPYLGYKTKDAQELAIVQAIESDPTMREKYIVYRNPSARLVANALSHGCSVGVCVGRAEFGARALGNRSLLIDPTNGQLKDRLNLSIKNRDFWMPFAPIVLDTYMDTYLEQLDQHQSRYMTVAFGTTLIGREDLQYAVHPADGSCRVQKLSPEDNPFLYSVLVAYEAITSRGGLLNTSFNVHGEPIVNTVEDAFSIFSSTAIDCLLLNGFLLTKSEVTMNDQGAP
jgi:carbamoyltransferase